jgi:hypothetical protein
MNVDNGRHIGLLLNPLGIPQDDSKYFTERRRHLQSEIEIGGIEAPPKWALGWQRPSSETDLKLKVGFLLSKSEVKNDPKP